MSKIKHIQHSVQAELQAGNVIPAALNGSAPSTSALGFPVGGIAGADAGVWECTPGSWRRATPNAEVMHFVAGDCTFTPDGEEPIHIRAGDTVIFPTHTEGTWVVTQTVRKVYVTLKDQGR